MPLVYSSSWGELGPRKISFYLYQFIGSTLSKNFTACFNLRKFVPSDWWESNPWPPKRLTSYQITGLNADGMRSRGHRVVPLQRPPPRRQPEGHPPEQHRRRSQGAQRRHQRRRLRRLQAAAAATEPSRRNGRRRRRPGQLTKPSGLLLLLVSVFRLRQWTEINELFCGLSFWRQNLNRCSF